MNYEDVLNGALELCGEPTGVLGSGRWSTNELQRALNGSVQYIFDVLDENTNIYEFTTVDGDDVYEMPEDLQSSSKVIIDGHQIPKVASATMPAINPDNKGVPRQCAVAAGGSVVGGYSLLLWPIPDKEYDVSVIYSGFQKLNPNDDIPLPDKFLDVLIFGTASNMCKKLIVNKNNNSLTFELERNKLLNQITISNSTSDVTGLWSHG